MTATAMVIGFVLAYFGLHLGLSRVRLSGKSLLADVVAIELMCAAQGLDFHLAGEAVDDDGRRIDVEKGLAGRGTRSIHARVREGVPRWDADRVLHTDLRTLGAAVRAGRFGPDAITLAEPHGSAGV